MDNILSNLSLLTTLAPVINLELIINGLLVGAIFGLIAYGMALVWGVMDIINVAQGAFVMLGGYTSFYFIRTMQGLMPNSPHIMWIVLSMVVAALAVGLFAVVVFKLVIEKVLDRDLFVSLLATFGIELVMQQGMNQLFTAEERVVDAHLQTFTFLDYMLNIPGSRALGALLGVAAAVVIVLLVRYSKFGRAMRATAQNARAARIMGIDTRKIYAMTFALNGAICGVAGSIVAFVYIIHPFQGLIYTLRSFVIVILAGVGNIVGVIFAALGLGVYENYAGFILGPEYQNGMVFIIVPIALLVRAAIMRRKRQYLK
ncbi:MAG: branched-chain amino acid ABC transporter permease [Rhodobacterales bacterium]